MGLRAASAGLVQYASSTPAAPPRRGETAAGERPRLVPVDRVLEEGRPVGIESLAQRHAEHEPVDVHLAVLDRPSTARGTTNGRPNG
jgi:hypothetical protein